MISTALFLSAGLMTSPVIIQDVQASREAGHLRVEVAADGGIDPDGARTRIDGGTLLIYLGGARVKADNRSWDLADGSGEIRAHRHKFETELVVPLAGNGCTGPVELQGSDTGITALVGCEGGVVADTATTTKKVKADAKAEQLKTEKLKALVELPEVAPESKPVPEKVAAKVEPKVEVKANEKVEAKVEAKPPAALVAAENKTEVPAETKPAETKAAEAKPALPAAVVTGDATNTGTAPAAVPAGGLRSIGVPAMLLAILAAGAYFFARRRRTISVRRIQILETASLGPKRSLVVARIGEETLILGTSEAGITLLKGDVGSTSVAKAIASVTSAPVATMGELESRSTTVAREAAEADAAAFEISQPLEEALADIPEPDGVRPTARGGFRAIEGGLAGLFNSRRKETQKLDAEDKLHERFEARLQERLSNRRPSRLEESFDDLLEDSLEDQELRQKLAAGMSTRVR